MASWTRFLPFTDLAGYSAEALRKDAVASATLTFLAVPQGIAYAMIAGLPPVMGLYASTLPTIIGALFRSSRHVVTGPTNALSLLVGTAGAAAAGLDPVPTVLLLSFLVGVIQVSMGALRLGVLVDYISLPVVMGYITGAGVLIGIGQLHHLTETQGASGTLFEKVWGWSQHLAGANGWAIGVGALTLIGIVALRRIDRRIPAPMAMLAVFTALSWALDGGERYGLQRIADLSPIPAGLPPLSLPGGEGRWGWSFDDAGAILPIAVAVTVLSLVESSAVARSISARSGQRLDISVEFVGQGLGNLCAAFCGGYPTSGSLSRSGLNHQIGAVSRVSGVLNGVMMAGVLLALGPVLNHTPIASLAGLLFVVAYDLVDVERIKKLAKGRRSDAAAFLVTVLATWVLRLDHAIYVGVGVSLFLFLRSARLLTIHRLLFDEAGRPMELRVGDPALERQCAAIRMLQIEGQLFFGAAGELATALDEVIADPDAQVIWLRLRRAFGMDATVAQVLGAAASRLHAQGRHLILVGVRPAARGVLERTGTVAVIGEDNVFSKTDTWLESSNRGMKRALDLIGEHGCERCPVEAHLRSEHVSPAFVE